MSLLDLEPHKTQRVMDLVQQAGLNVSDWRNFKNGPNFSKAASNPKYCYNWSFVDGELIVLNFWYTELKDDNGRIYRKFNMREFSKNKDTKPVWRRRARIMDNAIRMAYQSQLPVRIIISSGFKRDSDDIHAKASKVDKRILDPLAWAVSSYDIVSGECTLERGLQPIILSDELSFIEQNDIEMPEGEQKERLTKHRRREGRLRRQKIDQALSKNNGKLICEVPNCNFDFIKIYGVIGEGYAQVHHIIPLSEAPADGRNTKLEDLAIVCANCHVMIHRNGECRPMDNLIPAKKKK